MPQMLDPTTVALAGTLQFKIILSPLWIYGLVGILMLYGFLKQVCKRNR